MKKMILVTGDVVWDTHIARLPWSAKGYYEPHRHTQLRNRCGGAWYLRDVIQGALKSAAIEADVIAPREAGHVEIEENSGPGGIAKGFSVWEWFEGEPKPGAWRIEEFLGCQSAKWDGEHGLCQTEGEQPERPDVLVIDDLGLGFVSNEKAWPKCLADPEAGPGSIVAKLSPPFDSPLWVKLLAPEWAVCVTVVIAAASLRDAGARLGRGYSWDQTIEEVQRCFEEGGVGRVMRHCKRVIVLFGRSGAAVFSRCAQSPEGKESIPQLQFDRFVYDPANLEGTWASSIKGKTFGIASMMTASLVCHELREPPPSTHLPVTLGIAAAREATRLA